MRIPAAGGTKSKVELRNEIYGNEAAPAEEPLQGELDRLEAAVARKDAELCKSRAESGLKDLLIKEMQAAMERQEKILFRLQNRIEDLERRLSSTMLRL